MSHPEEKMNLKLLFDDASKDAMNLRNKLAQLYKLLDDDRDRKACENIMTDLMWVTENCTVLGLHQIGEALNDPGAGSF